jgi:uncharacterized protein with PIN domain
MNTAFIDILKKFTAEQGREALLNPAKCKAFLADYTKGEYKKESRLLLQALEAGVQKAIADTEELEICKKQQVRVLQEEYFLAAEIAADVVDTLALVLREEQKNKTSQSMLCANCGKELQKEWKVCPYCGTSTAKIQQKPSQTKPVETEAQPEQTQNTAPVVREFSPTPAAQPNSDGALRIIGIGLIIFFIICAVIGSQF